MKDILLILPTLLAISVLMLIVKIASIVLRLTGMDEKKAMFQSLSALTGAGFTTKELELIMKNPLRRKVISWLMVVGYAGIITIMVTFTSSIITSIGYMKYLNIAILFGGLYIVYRIANHEGIVKRWNKIIERKLIKYPVLDEPSAEDLLHFIEGYELVRITVSQNLSLANRRLSEITLSKEKYLIIGIERDGTWLPIPDSNEVVKENDKIVVYGSLDFFKNGLGV